jgi:hypothetical protein
MSSHVKGNARLRSTNWTAVILALLMSPAALRADTVFDPVAGFDASFSAGSNPDGPWSYGWSATLSSAFNLNHQHFAANYGAATLDYWNDTVAGSVAHNVGQSYDDGNVDFSSGALMLHYGGTTYFEYTHILFTAPTTADYAIAMTFTGLQHGVNSDVHILDGSNSLFGAFIAADRQTQSYSGSVFLNAGQTLDFAIGGGTAQGTIHPGWTGISGTITESSVSATPVPSSLAMLAGAAAVGGIGAVVRGARRRIRKGTLIDTGPR